MDVVEKKSRKEVGRSKGCSLRGLLKVSFRCVDCGSQRIC